ncbi:hypothetical protein [Paenibacillus taichungensis]
MNSIQIVNATDEQSVEYWKQRALDAEQENNILRRKLASVPERIQQLVRVGIEAMIEDQILKPRKVMVKGKELQAKERMYESGHAKLVLIDEDGRDYIEVSIDRPDVKRETNEIVLNTTEGNRELVNCLNKAGLLNMYVKPLDENHCIAKIHL